MKKILISGLGGSLFPYFHEQLASAYDLYYVDANPLVTKLYPDYNVFLAPGVTRPEYPEFILGLLRQHRIDVYMPLIDEEIPVAHGIRTQVPEVFLFSPDTNFARLCLDKYALMRRLAVTGLSRIDSWMGDEFTWRNQKAVFVKPVHGRGSRGARVIRSARELEAYYLLEKYAPAETLIQELVEGQEYTVGLTSNRHDQVLAVTPKRVIAKKGITIEAELDNNPAIIALCERLNQVLKPRGAINIQLFVDEAGALRIFEINPRFSTTSIMSFHGGVDEVSLLLEHWDAPSFAPRRLAREGVRLIRRWENCFYDA